MLNSHTDGAIDEVRSVLDEIGYRFVTVNLTKPSPPHAFPEFRGLQTALKRASPSYRVLLALLLQGHPVSPEVLEEAFPQRFVNALVACGLIGRTPYGDWKTPNLLIWPTEGLYLVVSPPPHYPSSEPGDQPVYLGYDSLLALRALPARVSGRALDLCTGSGIGALTCAMRGADRVVAVDVRPHAVQAAAFNARLNGLSDRVEVRQGDLLGPIAPAETFDLIYANPPFLPVPADVAFPLAGDGGPDGLATLSRLLAALPASLADGGEAIIYCQCLGSQHEIAFNRTVLAPLVRECGWFARAYVSDKLPLSTYATDALPRLLLDLRPDLTAQEIGDRCRAWRVSLDDHSATRGSAYLYSQIIRIWTRHEPRGVVKTLPFYEPALTDPLLAGTALHV